MENLINANGRTFDLFMSLPYLVIQHGQPSFLRVPQFHGFNIIRVVQEGV